MSVTNSQEVKTWCVSWRGSYQCWRCTYCSIQSWFLINVILSADLQWMWSNQPDEYCTTRPATQAQKERKDPALSRKAQLCDGNISWMKTFFPEESEHLLSYQGERCLCAWASSRWLEQMVVFCMLALPDVLEMVKSTVKWARDEYFKWSSAKSAMFRKGTK